MRSRLIAIVLAGGLAATGVTACGTTKTVNAAVSAPSGFKADANKPGVQLTLTLKGSPSVFPSSGGSLTHAQEQAILDSSLVLTVHAANGTNLANAGTGGQMALALDEGGNSLAQLEVVGSTLFARVDISGIAAAYGLDGAKAAKARAALQRLAPQVAGLGDLAAGKWVSLDLGVLNQFAQTAGVSVPSLPQLLARVVSSFFDAMSRGTVSPANANSQMTIAAPKLVSELAQGLSQAFASTPYASKINAAFQKAEARIANKSADVTVTSSGGSVSNIELPLNQFDTAHKLSGPASANLAISEAGPVSAPSGATAINLGQLIHALIPGLSTMG